MNEHIVIYSDDPDLGGVAQYNHAIALALVEAGYRVTLVRTYSKSSSYQTQREQGVDHAWISYDTKRDFLRSITDTRDAERIFAELQPDLIHFSDCCPVSSIAAKQVAIGQNIPFSIIVHFTAPYLAENFKVCLPVIEKQYQRARAVVLVSQDNRDLLVKLFRATSDKTRVILNGRPAPFFQAPSLETRTRLRTEMRLPENAVVCFTAARLEEVKGFQHLLAAAEQLHKSKAWEQLYFVWAGDGDLRSSLQQRIDQLGLGEHFRLLGQRSDINELFDASDIFALPSHFEGMPLCVMEAMAKGLPVIASAVSGTPEELGDTGRLITNPVLNPVATVNELIKGLESWVIDAEARARAGEACHQRASKLFKEERMTAETIALLQTALPRQQRPKGTPRPSITSGLLKHLSLNAGTQSLQEVRGKALDLAVVDLGDAVFSPPYLVKSAVCMLVFNRPAQTARVFEAVRRARPSKLLLVADGPRADRPAEAAICEKVRAIVTAVDWPCEVHTNFAPANMGCTPRVVSGLNWVFSTVEECIILEDDCLPSHDFFRFCDTMLERYRNNSQIRCVSGNSFQFGLPRGPNSYFFTPHILIWGWATWRRAWRDNDTAMKQWPALRARQWLRSIFVDTTAQAYWTAMFDAAANQRTAWDCPWLFSCWAKGGLGISPAVDLVENIGFDHQATGNIANVHPIFIKLYGHVPLGSLPAELTPPITPGPDIMAALFTQRFHYEQNWALLRRELASSFLRMNEPTLRLLVSRIGHKGLRTLIESGLAEIPVSAEDDPLARKCTELLRTPTIGRAQLIAALFFHGV